MRLRYDSERKFYSLEVSYYDKDIPKNNGFHWNPFKKLWETPSNFIASKFYEHAYPDELRNDLKKVLKSNERSLELNNHKIKSEIKFPIKDGQSYMDFQSVGIEYILSKSHTLLGDEMGLGKSIQSIGCINVTNPKKVLIICPSSVKVNWQLEIEKFCIYNYFIKIIRSGTSDFMSGTNVKSDDFVRGDFDGSIGIVNYDILHRLDFEKLGNLNLLICDEAHKLKGKGTKRTKAFLSIKADRCLYLTGTAILNNPKDLIPVLKHSRNIMHFGGEWNYMTDFCGATRDRFGHIVFSNDKNLSGLHETLCKTFMIRRRIKDVLPELPPKIRKIVHLDSSQEDKQKSLRREMQSFDDYIELKKKLDISKIAMSSIQDKAVYQEYKKQVSMLQEQVKASFNVMAKMRYEIAMKKLPYAIEEIEDALELTDKLIVFAHHKDVISGIVTRFKDVCVSITGETPEKVRNSIVHEFQNNSEIKIFVGSTLACGEGVNLTAANTVLFVELDWVPARILQAEGRPHRYGQKRSVLVEHLVFDGSLDARMAKVLISKQEMIEKALDSQLPGMDFTDLIGEESEAIASSKTVMEAMNNSNISQGVKSYLMGELSRIKNMLFKFFS